MRLITEGLVINQRISTSYLIFVPTCVNSSRFYSLPDWGKSCEIGILILRHIIRRSYLWVLRVYSSFLWSPRTCIVINIAKLKCISWVRSIVFVLNSCSPIPRRVDGGLLTISILIHGLVKHSLRQWVFLFSFSSVLPHKIVHDHLFLLFLDRF